MMPGAVIVVHDGNNTALVVVSLLAEEIEGGGYCGCSLLLVFGGKRGVGHRRGPVAALLKSLLAGCGSERIASFCREAEDLSELKNTLRTAIIDDPPAITREGSKDSGAT